MNSLESIASGIGSALEPLTSALASPKNAEKFLNYLGWELPPGVEDIGLTSLNIIPLIEKITDLRAAGKFEGSSSGVTLSMSADVLTTVQGFFSDFNTFTNGLASTASADYLNRTQIRQQLPRRLLDFLLIEELRQNASPVMTFFSLTGVIHFDPYNADPVNYQTAHIRHVVSLDQIVPLLSDPQKQIAQFFSWGTPQFDPGKLLTFYGFFLNALGGIGKLTPLSQTVEERLAGHPFPLAATTPMPQLVSILKRGFGFDPLHAGVSFLGLRPTVSGGADGGFAFSPFIIGTTDVNFPLRDGFSLAFDTTENLSAGSVVTFRPGQPLQILSSVIGTGSLGSGTSGRMVLRTQYQHVDGSVIPLLSLPLGATLDMKAFNFSFGVDGSGKGLSPLIEFGLNGIHFHLEGLGTDGFLAQFIPSSLDADFDLTIGWSGSGGVYIQGSSSFEFNLPLHIDLGVISLEGLSIDITFKGGTIPLELGVDLKGSLGPMTAVVQGIGITATLSFPANNSGNLGPLQLDLGFKPPDGVGLTIDTGLITGGGFLYFNPDKGEYFGALELEFTDLFSLKAVGIINTKMPDGSPGFSLLILITADFIPIQLGFGFTLNGVGGLLGLNRTMNVDALKEGVKTNAIKSILFPQDIIANIDKIVSDLEQIFPAYQGHFIVGPMGELGWAAIITLELGILIEIPDPKIAILGVLKALIPSEDVPLLRIQVNFLGLIDFDNQLILFNASLYDSNLLVFTLTGDMAFRLCWGDNPYFILSVGGFNPAFKDAPPDLQNMARLGISLLNNDFIQLSVTCYFAVTSNSVQFGANAQLYAGVGALNIYGQLGFDVLFQFDPFKFAAGINVTLQLRSGDSVIMGISVNGQLTGPAPWYVHGDASYTYIITISVSFSHGWGDPGPGQSQNKIDIIGLLTAAIADNRNWRVILPDNNSQHVSIKSIDPGTTDPVIHPFGTLTFSERIVPLGIDITRFGNDLPQDAHHFDIAASDPGISTIPATDQFAAANFFDLTDDQKLSQHSYDTMTSGFSITSTSNLLTSAAISEDVDYKLSYLGQEKNILRFVGSYRYAKNYFKSNLQSSAVSKSSLSHTLNRVSSNAPDPVSVVATKYAIANTTDMKLYSGSQVAESYSAVQDQLNTLLTNQPALRGQVQIVLDHELNPN